VVNVGLISLRAGALSCALDGADVRDLRVGGQRVLTRLYIAVRDESWNTIPFRLSPLRIDADDQHFAVQLSCSVDQPPIRAEWEVLISGTSAGTFSYGLRGQALSSFHFAKIGLNLHHPLPETLGARYVARRGGTLSTGTVPNLVEPQFFVDGKLTGMFMPYDELVLGSAADDEVVFRFSGDEFEMQDHRNWTDYNLKSYGTPLEVPLPLRAEPGQVIDQSVVVDLRGARQFRPGAPSAGGQAAETPGRETLVVDRTRVARRPRLGSEFPDERAEVDAAAGALIGTAALDYVRLNLDLVSDEGVAAAAIKARQIAAWGYPLELVLVVSTGDPRPEEVGRLRRWLEEISPRLERVVVLEAPRGFYIGRTTSPPGKVRAYRSVVEDRCGPTNLVSATEQYFAEINRWWPDLAGVDGVGYTICPQVHAADDISLMENTWGQADTVLTARARSGGRCVHVTSVAMIGKFGPYPAGVPDVPVLSAYGDPRQQGLFGAAWTVSSLRQLVGSGVASATYFELVGPRGLVRAESAGSSAAPAPVCRVLEAALAWGDGNLVNVGTLEGASVVGLGAEWPDRSELLVANLAGSDRGVELSGLAADVVELSQLSTDPARGAEWTEMAERPQLNRATGAGPGRHGPGRVEFVIGSYGVVRVRTA
jgi:hypothetical protein